MPAPGSSYRYSFLRVPVLAVVRNAFDVLAAGLLRYILGFYSNKS